MYLSAAKKLHIRAAALLSLLALLLSVLGGLPVSAAGDGGNNASGNNVVENLGNISECSYDPAAKAVTVAGTVYHKVFTASRYTDLALYRVMPWENAEVVLSAQEPVARAPMSLRFSFSVPCASAPDRLCMFAVAAVSDDGGVQLLTSPKYYSAGGAGISSLGFKGVCTPNVSDAIDSGAGTAIVDVYLDRLESSRHSGFVYRPEGENYYLDREYISELDTVIRAYYASDADVLIRLLVSAQGREVCFAPPAREGVRYRGIVIRDGDSLSAVYEYVSFLVSRYSSSEYGKISGVILGRAADEPAAFGYTGLPDAACAENYASVLAVIGAAIADSSVGGIAVIVPVGDRLTEIYTCCFETLLSEVGSILSQRTGLNVAVMLESTHNPYGLYDEFFDSGSEEEGEEGEGEQPGEDGELPVDFPDPDESDESDEDPDEPEEPEELPVPVPNTISAGFVCSDTLDTFELAMLRLRYGRSCFLPGYLWCWYPDAATGGSALSVCYTYNYLRLATDGADCFIVSFDDSEGDVFYSISHLFRGISSDEEGNNELTQYARSVFAVDSWETIIDGYTERSGVYEKNSVVTLTDDGSHIRGSYPLWDFSRQSGTQGWYAGFHCSTLKSVSSGGTRFLNAHISDPQLTETSTTGVSSGMNYADIGFIFDTNEPLLDYDGLNFELCAGEDDGSIFEVKIAVYAEKIKIDAAAVVTSGKRTSLHLDTSAFPRGVKPHAIRFCIRRINSTGNYDVKLYRISIDSRIYSNAVLAELVEAARSEIRTNEKNESEKKNTVFGGVAALGGAAAVVTAVPILLDRKKKKSGASDGDESGNE